MIGLVLVSHSAALAAGVAELVRGAAGEGVPLRAVGGLDAPGAPLGTDAVRVGRALEEVWSEEGVLVLCDLGSAVLSAELARDLLPPERAARVLVCDAPLVEGAVAAAVQIGLWATLAEVAAEARGALWPKQLQLAGPAAGEALAAVAADEPVPPLPRHETAPSAVEAPQRRTLSVLCPHGLHARPAARLVRTAARFPGTRVRVRRGAEGPEADARSLNALATLGVRQGDALLVSATGPQASEALDALAVLAESGFGEKPSLAGPAASAPRTPSAAARAEGAAQAECAPVGRGSPTAVEGPGRNGGPLPRDEGARREAPTDQERLGLASADDWQTRGTAGGEPEQVWRGMPTSPGVALGPVRHPRPPALPSPAIAPRSTATLPPTAVPLPTDLPPSAAPRPRAAAPSPRVASPAAEVDRLEHALARARVRLDARREELGRRAGPEAQAIVEAHRLMLDDEALLGPAREALGRGGLGAEAAWRGAVEEVAATYLTLEDPYQRERAADVREVGGLVEVELAGAGAGAGGGGELEGPGVVVAPGATAAEVGRFQGQGALGLALAGGSPTSHAAVLARALGLPVVTGLGEALLALREGTPLALDGAAGLVWPEPSPARAIDIRQRAAAVQAEWAVALAGAASPAVTLDGRRVEVVANIGSVEDARAAVAAGADGVGVFRTELLYLDRATGPDEDEQEATYRAAAEALGGRPLTVRTLDAGGDKPLPYLDLPREANPFLGERALRLCLARPALFRAQLRAVLRVAADHPVRLLLPMVAVPAELRAARAQLELARAELGTRGVTVPAQVPLGVMVEIPSAALRARALAAQADFLSIGTNDLAQYALAAERGNPRLGALADPFQPAVLELVRLAVEGGHAASRAVAVCGELAADPLAAALLVALGVDELSVSAPALPRVKAAVRAVDAGALREAALVAIGCDEPEDVRATFAAALAR